MKRRAFITVLGGAALTWPLAVRAQQTPRLRRVGVLIPFPNDREPLVKNYLSAFKQRLHELGWNEGQNIRFDYRFTGQVPERMSVGAAELISLAPDIIVVWADPSAAVDAQGDADDPCRFCRRFRSSWRRHRIEPGAPGRKHHRLPEFRDGHWWKMGGFKEIAPSLPAWPSFTVRTSPRTSRSCIRRKPLPTPLG